jgi:hypothetical protein
MPRSGGASRCASYALSRALSGGDRRPGGELGDEPGNLAIGPELGAAEDQCVTLATEIERHRERAREMKLAASDDVAKIWILSCDPGGFRATVGRVLFSIAESPSPLQGRSRS